MVEILNFGFRLVARTIRAISTMYIYIYLHIHCAYDLNSAPFPKYEFKCDIMDTISIMKAGIDPGNQALYMGWCAVTYTEF